MFRLLLNQISLFDELNFEINAVIPVAG